MSWQGRRVWMKRRMRMPNTWSPTPPSRRTATRFVADALFMSGSMRGGRRLVRKPDPNVAAWWVRATLAGAFENAGMLAPGSSGEECLHDVAAHIGEAEVTPLEVVGQVFVIEAHQLEDRRVEIVDIHRILHD